MENAIQLTSTFTLAPLGVDIPQWTSTTHLLTIYSQQENSNQNKLKTNHADGVRDKITVASYMYTHFQTIESN